MITDALLKKIIETFTIKTRKKKERTIVLILPLNLPFNPIKSKGIRIRIIIVEHLKETDLTDLIRSEN